MNSMRHTVEDSKTLAQLRWLIVAAVGLGGFASIGGLMQTFANTLVVSFFVGMLAGVLASYAVYTLTENGTANSITINQS